MTFKSVIYINSYIDRLIEESTSNFTVYLPKPIVSHRKLYLRLDSIELPNTSYNIQSQYSRLWYRYDTTGVNTLHNIQVNYSRHYALPTDLITELNSKFTANGHPNIVVTYDILTKKITLSNTTGVSIRIISDYIWDDELANTYDHINSRLGFTQDLRTIIIADNTSLIASGLLRLLRTQCYYILCDEISNSTIPTTILPNPQRSGVVLGRIMSNEFGILSSLILGNEEMSFLCNTQYISSLHFRILDDEFIEVDLNGVPITMSIVVTYE